ncbi:hypothetical protein DV738_g3977, partial [Chaetothyriales sp. CBS 135597]
MAEPINSTPNAGDAGDDETTQNLPANAEDRKAAAALNALNANAMSQEGGESASKQPSAADQEALGKAMSRLEIASGQGKQGDGAGKKNEAKKEAEVKKKIKIASEDVNFLIQEWRVTEPFIASQCSLGEGPYWVKERNELRFLDINNHKLYVVDLNRGPDSVRTIDTGVPLGVTADIEGVDSSEVILTGAKDGVSKFNLQTQKHEYVAKYWSGADAEEKTKKMRSNDGNVDSHGRFWVSTLIDPEISELTDEDVLFLLDHSGKLEVKHTGAIIPNGISWNAKDDTMFFTSSPNQAVYAFDFDSKTGNISGKRTFFSVKEEGVYPDGHAIDAQGNIWHALYGGSRVIRISPSGEVTGVVHLPTRNITCCVFAGTTLYITSAKEAEPENYPESARYGGSLFKVDVGVEGVPRHKARLNA